MLNIIRKMPMEWFMEKHSEAWIEVLNFKLSKIK